MTTRSWEWKASTCKVCIQLARSSVGTTGCHRTKVCDTSNETFIPTERLHFNQCIWCHSTLCCSFRSSTLIWTRTLQSFWAKATSLWMLHVSCCHQSTNYRWITSSMTTYYLSQSHDYWLSVRICSTRTSRILHSTSCRGVVSSAFTWSVDADRCKSRSRQQNCENSSSSRVANPSSPRKTSNQYRINSNVRNCWKR